MLELPPCAVEDGGKGWEAEQVLKAQRYGPGTLRVGIRTQGFRRILGSDHIAGAEASW